MSNDTLGMRRVRHTFNPGSNALVSEIKQKTAELIDLCEQSRGADGWKGGGPETGRLWSFAQTHYEDAAMWAVKAATA